MRLRLVHGFTQTIRSWEPVEARLLESKPKFDRAAATAISRPSPGPTPDTTTTLPSSSIPMCSRPSGSP